MALPLEGVGEVDMPVTEGDGVAWEVLETENPGVFRSVEPTIGWRELAPGLGILRIREDPMGHPFHGHGKARVDQLTGPFRGEGAALFVGLGFVAQPEVGGGGCVV